MGRLLARVRSSALAQHQIRAHDGLVDHWWRCLSLASGLAIRRHVESRLDDRAAGRTWPADPRGLQLDCLRQTARRPGHVGADYIKFPSPSDLPWPAFRPEPGD